MMRISGTTESLWIDGEQKIKITNEYVAHSPYKGWACGSRRQTSTKDRIQQDSLIRF